MLFPKSLVSLLALASGATAGRCKPSSPTTTSQATLQSSTTTTSTAASTTSKGPPTSCRLDPNPPAGLVCGVNGFRNPYGLGILGLPPTVEECALLCELTPSCSDFSWTPNSSYKCHQYTSGGPFAADPNSPSIYYADGCWVCDSGSPPAVTTF